jgi:L-asparaginase II
MQAGWYEPIVEVTRGGVAESVHYGAAAVADRTGRLVAWVGDPRARTFLRSSAKPFQAIPLVESGGFDSFGLTPRQLALICASHSGTDAHKAMAESIQAKVGVTESYLLCGTHPPSDVDTWNRMREAGEPLTPNRHNCSGKHSGMLALARYLGLPLDSYIDPDHPVQDRILETFSAMCGLMPGEVVLGVDGCSVPTFAVPLIAAATGYARLADPSGLSPERARAVRRIVEAMTSNPDMVDGPGRFDTRLMQASAGRILSKGGAEGFRGLAIMPGALGRGSPGLGVVIKVADGDMGKLTDTPPGPRAGRRAALDLLRQLGALDPGQLDALVEFGTQPVMNFRQLVVGESRSCLCLHHAR